METNTNTPNPTPQETATPNQNSNPTPAGTGNDPTPAPATKKEEEKSTTPSVQDLMTQIATLKRAVDRASAEAADYKKKYNATRSEKELVDEQKAEEQAKKEEEFKALKREVAANKYAKQYTQLGYGDLAEKAAIAQVDGDTDELFRIQQDVQAKMLKDAQDAWIKTRPQVQTGSQNEQADDPFLKGFMGK